jgi:hypothetical protein
VFKRAGDDALAQSKSVTICASAALIQIKADQCTSFSDGLEDFVPARKSRRGRDSSNSGQKAAAVIHRYRVHRITLSQTLPCLMRIRAIVKPKRDMIATTVIAPQM